MPVAKKKAVKKKSVAKKAQVESPLGPIHAAEPSREQETWDNMNVHDIVIGDDISGGPLPEIPARPGYVQRWVRTKIGGVDDPQNMSAKFNQYWRRRDPKSLPTGTYAPTIHVEGVGDAIGISGMVLMERPQEVHDQFKRRIEQRTQAQRDSVEQSLFSEHKPADQGFGRPGTAEDKSVAKVGSGVMPVDD